MQLKGLPNDILANLNPFALMILIPFCDMILYPGLRRMGIKFSPIKRIAAGFYTGSLAMIWAAVLQFYIYHKSECGHYASNHKCDKAPINVWAQTGSYVLLSISEIFASITVLEYAFSKAPKNMRSMVQSAALFTSAISAALSQAFVSVSADPLLIWNYMSMAILAFLAGTVFYVFFRGLDKREDSLNALPRGHANKAQHIEEVESASSVHDSIKLPVAPSTPVRDGNFF